MVCIYVCVNIFKTSHLTTLSPYLCFLYSNKSSLDTPIFSTGQLFELFNFSQVTPFTSCFEQRTLSPTSIMKGQSFRLIFLDTLTPSAKSSVSKPAIIALPTRIERFRGRGLAISQISVQFFDSLHASFEHFQIKFFLKNFRI